MTTLAPRARSFAGKIEQFFMEPQAPQVALEFSSIAIHAARVEWVKGKPELRALAAEPLSEGAFAPTLEDPGFARKEEMREVTKRLLARVSPPPLARAAIVVPDIVARFRLFAQEEVKTEPKKRDAVVAFRMQKLIPFAAADARFASAWPRSETEPVLGIAYSAAVLGAYEQAASAFGLDVGLVETSSMALLRRLPAEGDVLLIRHDPAWLTLTRPSS